LPAYGVCATATAGTASVCEDSVAQPLNAAATATIIKAPYRFDGFKVLPPYSCESTTLKYVWTTKVSAALRLAKRRTAKEIGF